MTYGIGTAHDFTPLDRGRLSRKSSSRTVSAAVALTFCSLAGVWMLYPRPATAPRGEEAPVVAFAVDERPASTPAPNLYVALFDPTFSLGYTPVTLEQSAPRGSNFESIAPAPSAAIAEADAEPESDQQIPASAIPQRVEPAPLPTPRPSELALPTGPGPFHASGRRLARQNRTAVAVTAAPDQRSFFDKLFGMFQPSGPALAYAAPEAGISGNARNIASRDHWTAVYDISAHTVYMPDGTRLEAHSGLGAMLDDPRYVNERMRGATPPHVYALEPRAQLFHGVQALRLNPIGGGDVFGRSGLLAHTFMLGSNGQSNGCVSFRNYNAFLQAYMNGEVKRLLVVARLN